MVQALRIVVVKAPAPAELAEQPAIDLIADKLGGALIDAGYEVVATLAGDADLPLRIAELSPDMIIIDADSTARDVLEHVVVATRDAPRPIVMFTDEGETDRMHAALAAGVSAYVVAGLQPQRVKSILQVALARFQVDQRLRTELAETKTRLTERKLVERAKGILMSKKACTEDEAFRLLRTQAMTRNVKLVEMARRVIDAAELLG